MISTLAQFLFKIRNVIRFLQLDKSLRRLTSYSEDKDYWPHLDGLISKVWQQTDIPVCHLSSDSDDPGLLLVHPSSRTFQGRRGVKRSRLRGQEGGLIMPPSG